MFNEHKLSAGGLLRRLRMRKRRPDGSPWTQEHLAKVAGLSVKTVIRAEQGKAGTNSLSKIVDALDLDDRERELIARVYNPLRVSSSRLDDAERSKIEEELTRHMLALPELLPAYIVDEYWFIRTQNAYFLTLHTIKPDLLTFPESWHSVAVRFHPKLKMRGLQRDQWQKYYLGAMKAFRSSVASYEGRSRYNRLIRWLKSLEGFAEPWDDAGGNLELGHDVRVLITRPVFIRTGPEFQSWKMFQTEVVVSSQLPVFRLNIWMPLSSRWPETLRSLSKTAQALGYRLSRAPFIIEKHVDESRLQDIGGWIE